MYLTPSVGGSDEKKVDFPAGKRLDRSNDDIVLLWDLGDIFTRALCVVRNP